MNKFTTITLAISGLLAPPSVALEPAEILVLVNTTVPQSRELGEYYCTVRGVPAENVASLALGKFEEISRVDYDAKLLSRVREELAKRPGVKCVLCMYGMPLRVGAKTPSPAEKAEADRLKQGLDAAKAKAAPADAVAAKQELAKLEADILKLEQRESYAAVDSELMLVKWPDYPLARWALNPLHWQMPERLKKQSPPVMLTARLDGPTPDVVRRMIDDAVAVEKTGLAGPMVIDARGIAFDPAGPNEHGGVGYGGYDESFRETATLFESAKWPVQLDNKPKCLSPNAAKNVALYAGWYSHGKFIDSFTFTPGAVAWHLASSEATSLREHPGTLWCPNLLKAGAAVTLGPVAEPYAVAFPKPAEFFGFLATGKYCLAEVFSKTSHFASWQMTCLGDPLYTPFRSKPLLKESDLFASPKAGKPFFR
jgi:uncharacterized protein (TIGR03790 family)